MTHAPTHQREELHQYIDLKLTALGQPSNMGVSNPYLLQLARPLLRTYYEKNRRLGGLLCPVDARIQAFLDSYLEDVAPEGAPRLPSDTFVLDRPGLARVMSLPADGDTFRSPYLNSYRLAQGVLHNPKADRRTTQGVFHIVEGGLPIPADKVVVPKTAFRRLLEEALRPAPDVLTLPFTASQHVPARLWVSLLLRPLVCPATGRQVKKTMETRFFAPASLVSNLDFVEGIFGNGGDPFLPENDAALDVLHWTGHTGCVILAPHLAGIAKQKLGLPHYDQATEHQRREGMCWREEGEPYNRGDAFKVACRDERGVMVTIIADNYYGYCKKEVKTQISFSANLFGGAEEEHAGGAVAFPSYVLGHDFYAGRTVRMLRKVTLADTMRLLGETASLQDSGYAIDKKYSDVYYVPEGAEFHVREGLVQWQSGGVGQQLPLRSGIDYILPTGYRIRLEQQQGSRRWRLVGTRPDGTLCHKPCTVSGGGKSEISKSIANAILQGPVFVREYYRDMEAVAEILRRDYSTIHRQPPPGDRARRAILSPDRSLGSVIKLLTPSPEYKDEYNSWLKQLPQTIRQLVFVVKRYYRAEWGEDWREHFTVDRINGYLGHEMKYDGEKLVGNYLRVGFDPDGAWRIYKLRPDFRPADKLQMEDDITASVVVPREDLEKLDPACQNPSLKLVANCESLLFQRPDDAIHRGFDRQAELDIATPGTFLSNFEPLSVDQVRQLADRVVEFDEYTDPMRRLLEDFLKEPQADWVVSSAHPRVVDGKPSKNPRYLQVRPDLSAPRDAYLAEVVTRLFRDIPAPQPVYFPVNAVLAGRRGNPPEPKIGLPPLAVYNPLHYQELPELFMDWVSSLTGKSPSTTGFGSEGALTKRPFNALPPVVDLNNALVAAILTGYAGYTSAAGSIGPMYRVDHDISMLVPEIWCRMSVEDRDPASLIANGYLEKVNDFEWEGKRVLASRLGYRITSLFVDRFLGRIFETPNEVLTEELLRPERQDRAAFVSGVNAIVDSQQRVALEYFEDGTIDAACPPLKALLHMMAHGSWEGLTSNDGRFRGMFTREALLASEWYRERLAAQQQRDIALWTRHLAALRAFEARADARDFAEVEFSARLTAATENLARVSAPEYPEKLVGYLGADPRLGVVK